MMIQVEILFAFLVVCIVLILDDYFKWRWIMDDGNIVVMMICIGLSGYAGYLWYSYLNEKWIV